MATIYPTHTCFDDSLDFLEMLATRGEPFEHYTLVHAIVKPEGKRFAHAWLEVDGNVLFSGILEGRKAFFFASKEEYYEQLKIVKAVKYTVKEALKENLRTGAYGPWSEEYRKYCIRRTG